MIPSTPSTPSIPSRSALIALALLSCIPSPGLQAQTAAPSNILKYSTYLGGSSDDTVHAMAVDSQGNVYLAGETVSPDFPVTSGALQPKHGGVPGNDCSIFTGCSVPDAFVTKLNPSGQIVYSTYLGGTNADIAYAIAVDASGNAYVAGTTSSPNFPVTPGAFQTTPRSAQLHAFVAKLNATGSALIYSTLIGGSGTESGIAGVRVDTSGSAYIAGTTNSPDFPITAAALQTTAAQSTNPVDVLEHGFVCKLNPAGAGLIYSTYLSGSQGSQPNSMTLDSAGEVLVTGTTSSPDFPISKGAYQTTIPPSPLSTYAPTSRFISRLNASGNALIYSTFFAGLPLTNSAAIEVDAAGAAYITGNTLGNFTPTPGAFAGPINAGQYAATVYAVKLSGGGQLLYAVPIISSLSAISNAIAVDSLGNAWIAGQTSVANFPLVNAYQSSYSDSACYGGLIGPFAGSGDIVNCGDAFLSELDPAGASLLYSTYFGSNGNEDGAAVAIALDGSVWLAGTTASSLLPATVTALQTHRTFGPDCTFEGSPSAYGANICSDVFLSRFGPAPPVPAAQFEAVNSASYLPGAVAPGELVTLLGTNIGPPQSASYSFVGITPVGTALGGFRILFDATPAPLLYVGPNQINLIVPYDTAAKQHAQVTIENNGASGPAETIELADVSPGFTVVAPGIFSMAASGNGQASAFNQDGTVNGAAHPAPAGSIVGMYVTGLGVMNPAVADGGITQSSSLPNNTGTVEVFVGGVSAQVQYAGGAPYFPSGVSQINFVIPSGLPSGNQPVFVSAGHTEASQSGVWIAVK